MDYLKIITFTFVAAILFSVPKFKKIKFKYKIIIFFIYWDILIFFNIVDFSRDLIEKNLTLAVINGIFIAGSIVNWNNPKWK